MAVKKSVLMKSGNAWVKRQTVADLARFPEENPNPVMRASDDGTLIYANPAGKALLKTLGWRADDKLPAVMREQMGPTAAVARAEFDLTASDRVFSVTASRSADGGGINLYFRDVTERRRAEEALRRLNAELERRVAEQTSELHRSYEIAQAERQRLYDVLETLPVYVVLLTPDYHVPFANRFFEERFGKSDGQRCFEYLFQRTEPCEDCETYKVLKTHAPHHWEWTGPDGRNQIRSSVITINGRNRGYYTSRNGVRMLVVEPSVNQRIRINGTIEIVVLEIGNGEVRLGIDPVADLDAHMPTKYAVSSG